MASSLPYHEPSIETILKQSSFLLLLNAANHVLDATIYAGLVGQILVGIAWGTPGGKILTPDAQEVIVQLGYLGLILLVFEGGLSTSFSSLRANFVLSVFVALTGIAAPMALSFVLSPLIGASSLQAFAAGAALCATSLGTTFTLLGTSGLSASRLGVVLTSAAMMDDVVGLIMVQVISNLGSSPSLDAVTVIRPVFVSLAFAILLPLMCRFVVLPCTRWVSAKRQGSPTSWFSRLLRHEFTALCIHTATLIATVTGATYAGSSGLLGAYIAGAMISWWDAEAPHPCLEDQQSTAIRADGRRSSARPSTGDEAQDIRLGAVGNTSNEPVDGQPVENSTIPINVPSNAGSAIFEKYYQHSLHRILKPFFFASVGFSIPISQMFSGSVVWRGFVYTILMTVGKLFCGLWLLRIPSPLAKWQHVARLTKNKLAKQRRRGNNAPLQRAAKTASATEEKPLSVYPGMILGSAMVARGEIGYLISSIAEGGGVFRPNGLMTKRDQGEEPSEIFLIVTWAITLCTVLGPISMGYLVSRVRKLEKQVANGGGQGERLNVLGSWGVS